MFTTQFNNQTQTYKIDIPENEDISFFDDDDSDISLEDMEQDDLIQFFEEDLSIFDPVFADRTISGVYLPNSVIFNLENQVIKEVVQPTSCITRSDMILQSLTSIQFPLRLDIDTVDSDYMLKLIEDVMLLMRNLFRATNKEDYTVAIITFAKLRTDKPLTSLLLQQWNKYFGVELQADDAENSFSTMRNYLNDYSRVKTLPIFKKLYKFLMYCVGTSIFSKMGVKFDVARFFKIEKKVVEKEYYLGCDFVHCMLDTLLFLVETGHQCMVTGNLDPIFHSETSYDTWIKQVEELKIQSKFISNPEPHGFTVFDFLSRTDSAIEQGEAIVKFTESDPLLKRIAKTSLNEIKMIRADCLTKRLAQQDRKAPFSVLVAGGSSVGKSTFTKLLFYHFGKLFNLPTDPEYRYVRNPFDQYWTNFNSSQWCVQLDDIAFLHPNSSQGCDPSLMEMLQVINNVPYVPTQADIADKGKTPLRSRFVVATTNTESLNAETYFACPLAVQRRMPFVINILPKKEYCKDGCMLNAAALPDSVEGEYPDYWDITVKRVIPNHKVSTHMGQTGNYVVTHRFSNILDFIKWFNEVAMEAEKTQDKSMTCDANMSKSDLCSCGIPKISCSEHSAELQNDEMVIVPFVPSPLYQDNGLINSDWINRMNEQFQSSSTYQVFTETNWYTRWLLIWYYSILYLYEHVYLFRVFCYWFYGDWFYSIVVMNILHNPALRGFCYKMMGRMMYNRVCTNKNTIIFGASILALITMYKTMSYIFKCTADTSVTEEINEHKEHIKILENKINELQGVSEERGVLPVSLNDKHENVWYKDHYECTTFDVSPSTLSKCSWTLDQFESSISNNCVAFLVKVRLDPVTVSEKRTRAVCIGGHIYMCNNHSVPHDTFELTIISQCGKEGVNQNITLLITPGQLKRFPSRDVCFITINAIPPRKDIRSLFAKQSFAGRFDGKYLSRDFDGSIVRNNVCATQLSPNFTYTNDSLQEPIVCDMWASSTSIETKKGDCGSLLIVKSAHGPIILGIHVIGCEGKSSYALAISSQFLESQFPLIMSASTPNLQVGNYKQTLGELSKKACVRYIEEGTAKVFGSIVGFRGKLKSRVTKTLMCDLAVEAGHKCRTHPPVMNSYLPWRKAMLDMVRPVTHMDLTLLAKCRESFTRDILKGLTKEDLAEIKVYDNLTAVNGCAGLAYVDKMNRNTSAGFPFNKSKKYFINAIDPVAGLQNPVEVTPEILNEMDYIIVQYENSRLYHPIFTGSLKDEPVTLAKVMSAKTRVFCGAPMPWSLVVRKYLLSVVRLIQRKRFLFESGPGTIAQSKEWSELFDHITQFGWERIVAGDYEKFDKRMCAAIILECYLILVAIVRAAGYSDAEVNVVIGISEDTAHSIMNMNGDLMSFFGTNPSGHPLTVIINGLANSLYVRYCYAVNNPEGHCDDFKENIALMTYGDDMIMGVSEKCTFLNHTIMHNTLKDIDIGFTMADKTAESVPFIHINQASFLKRSWRYEPELNAWVCPIEEESIDKGLTMCVASKSMSPQLQAIEAMHNAVGEYFWYGREKFEEKRDLMYTFIEKLELQPYVSRDFMTWNDGILAYKSYD